MNYIIIMYHYLFLKPELNKITLQSSDKGLISWFQGFWEINNCQ